MVSFQKKRHRMSNVWHIFRPTLANIYAQGSMYTGEMTWWGLPGTGRQEPHSLGCPRQNCATNRQIFSTPSILPYEPLWRHVNWVQRFTPLQVLSEMFPLLSFSKSLHTLYFLSVNFPIRPAPVPLIQHTGFFPSILYIILINTYQSKALLIKLARWLHTPPCAPSEHPLAKIFSSLI